jgi:hypothetical protein
MTRQGPVLALARVIETTDPENPKTNQRSSRTPLIRKQITLLPAAEQG